MRGSIVAYGWEGARNTPECWDLDMTDFGHIADYLLSICAQNSPMRVQGVRVNFRGNEVTTQVPVGPQYEAIEVLWYDPTCNICLGTLVAAGVGIPVLNFPPRCTWHSRGPTTTKQRSTASHHSPSHGPCDVAGKFLVVRKDKKPFLPMHMEAMIDYVLYEAAPLTKQFLVAHGVTFQDPEDEEDKVEQHMLRFISRPAFEIFWEKYKREKGDTTTLSPYDIV